VAAATTLIMLTAPTACHRILFRRGDKEHLVAIANRFMLIGLAAMGLTTVGVVILLSDIAFAPEVVVLITAATVVGCGTLSWVMPLARRRALSHREPSARSREERSLTRRPDAA
jgi:uncharacterized protein DUF6328